ncbi:aldose epimerase family protein [Pedobacter psychrophilus]|nr:aldose epimerase family protein [Pedobacter psychrophilus]
MAVLSFAALNGFCNLNYHKFNTEVSNPKNVINYGDLDTLQGKKIDIYTIKNGLIKATFTNYGARMVSLWVPDKNGILTDVVLGLATVKDYLQANQPFFGPTIGRFGNRIAKGQFDLNGEHFQLNINSGGNTLHGGKNGFHNKVWDVQQPDSTKLILTYFAKDGEEGFPGNLKTKVTFSITDKGALKLEYDATTDKPTIVNLTNHSYFNLNGEGSGEIINHQLTIYADKYTPVNSALIPTGELANVKGTPFDFTKPISVGSKINIENEQLKYGKGYDHNFVLNGKKVNSKIHAATVVGDKSSIQLDIYTDEPGLQFYSGNYLKGKDALKNGSRDTYRSGFAIETQHFPDSPNQPSFPSTVLNPDKKYHTVSLYQFSISKN